MKFTIDQASLRKALTVVGRSVSTKSTIPALAYLRLTIDDEKMKLAATNLETGITLTLAAKGHDPGEIAIPYDKLKDFVAALDGGEIDAELDAKTYTMKLRAGRARSAIRCIDAGDLPALPSREQTPVATLPAATLARALDVTTFAAARDESRPVLACVNAQFDGARVTLSAADGFRMAVHHITLQGPASADFAINIPAKVCAEIARTLTSFGGDVELHIPKSRNQIVVVAPGIEIVGRLADGSFPDWRQLGPSNIATTLVAPRAALQAAARVVMAAGDHDKYITARVLASVDDEPGKVIISSKSDTGDENDYELDAVIAGPDNFVGLNGTYLIDALEALATLHDERVKISLQPVGQSFTVTPASHETTWHLIMPMYRGANA